jgi:S1-C subfamily serine protease
LAVEKQSGIQLIDRFYIKDSIPNSIFAVSGMEKGDILYSIEGREITSEQSFTEAKEECWNHTVVGDSVSVCLIRDGEKMFKRIRVPFFTEYRYMIKNSTRVM